MDPEIKARLESCPPKLQALLKEIASFPDRDSRSDLLIELSEEFHEVPAELATRPFCQDHLVPGCESEVYIWVTKNTDLSPRFYFAVENPQGISAKAMAVLIDQGLSGVQPEAIQKVPEEIIYDIFGHSITMGRGQGLMSMIRMAKFLSRPS